MIERATRKLRKKTGDPDLEPDWIRWTGRGRFRRECRDGDSLIQMWRPNKSKKPSKVIGITPVLLKQPTRKWTRFYLGKPQEKRRLSWSQFKRLLKAVGDGREIKAGSELLLNGDITEAIKRRWKTYA